MAVASIQTSLTAGEIAPSLLGHVDLQKFHVGATTYRNLFVSFRGGAYSRAGTAFVGYSKQTGRNYPCRLVSFQFSVLQGLTLEFGNQYMRVVKDGAFVTEAPISVLAVTQANPAVVSVANFASAATAVNGGTSASYVQGDQITLAGGSYTQAAVLEVGETALVGLALNSPGMGNYAAADTIALTGGTQTSPAQLTVSTSKVVSATIANPGTGGTPGTQTVVGTTGTGTKFQASVTVNGSGVISAVLSITVAGSYTANPSNPAAEPVTGGGLTGAVLNVVLGINTFTISNAGAFTVNAAGGTFTQASSSGTGTGATFHDAIFGPLSLSVVTPGSYSVDPANPVSQASTTGTGVGAEFDITWAIPYSVGDWIFLSGIGGMAQLNSNTYVVGAVTGTGFSLTDVFGNNIDSTGYPAYTSGGAAARIYTLATPYAEEDLPWLKWTQSADVMSICCWNQSTGTSYATQDLIRLADNDWSISAPTIGTSISAPASITGTATVGASPNVIDYKYVATAVDAFTGQESVASPIADIPDGVDISAQAGSNHLQISPVQRAGYYNYYKAPPAYTNNISGIAVPVGSLFGYIGQSYGTQFVDTNIIADLSQVPPIHNNPFAPGQVLQFTITSPSSGLTACTVTITSATGTGFVGVCDIDDTGALSGIIIENTGENYVGTAGGDTVVFSATGGSAPTATFTAGPLTGTQPSTVAYYQQRRAYASSPNNPDTYWMSQPGAYTNFDSRIPTIASDAITGTPWSVEVNGIQWMIPMPGGLVVLTGLSAWQLTGTGGSSLNPQPITPADQQAQPQAYNGVSATIPPIRILQDILYVQAKGSIVRDLTYQIFANIYTGTDLTQWSSHLFTGFQIKEWAWAEEPFKVVWAVRNDGALLSLTYLKEQEVTGWARHDTYGYYQSVCSVTEPPVDALYLAVQRTSSLGTAYMIERMDDRMWSSVEDAWCVDCGLSLPQPQPNASISAFSATGAGTISGIGSIVRGQGYSSGTTGTIVDNPPNGPTPGPGTGAVVTPTIVDGEITGWIIDSSGQNYVYPQLVIFDPAGTGTGASGSPILNNETLFAASAPVFSSDMVGWVIRMGGGIAVITSYGSDMLVTANIVSPIVDVVPNSPGLGTDIVTQLPGNWTLTEPVTTISGLQYLTGLMVTGLADGQVIPPVQVPSSGTITLPNAASSVTIGLGFQCQLQSPYLDAGQPSIQGQRKRIAAATARIEASRGIVIGTNQPDGSTQSPPRLVSPWYGMNNVPDKGVAPYPNTIAPLGGGSAVPLYTGDERIDLTGGFNRKPGQVAIQQSNPLPMQILAIIPELDQGDLTQVAGPARDQRRGGMGGVSA